jgi:hypothetical protein
MLKNAWNKIVAWFGWMVSDVPSEVESCEFCNCHQVQGCNEEERNRCEQLRVESIDDYRNK